jgi:HD-like signal output (HDOD) protein
MRFLDKDFAYTPGILHDIGKVALAATMPEAYARVVDRDGKSGAKPGGLLRSGRELCGVDHCKAERLLLAAWDLPPALIHVVGCHHDQ